MAIGDSFSVYMGTGTVNRQPSSGVFEEVSAIVKTAATDLVALYDGSNEVQVLINGGTTNSLTSAAAALQSQTFNMALKIGNTIYLRKGGTTDRIGASGVQVDA